MDTKEFLGTVFQNKDPDNHYVQLWEKAGHKSGTFRDVSVAANWAEKQSCDVYFSVGLYDSPLKSRGTRDDVVAIHGCHLDIDIDGEGHKSKKLPPDEETAWRIINGMQLEPSLVVNSGNGLHVYWLLQEPLTDMHRAKTLLERCIRTGQRLAGEAGGYTLDPVHDCTRLMRLPGTKNYKDPENPKPVKVKEDSGEKYGPSELEEVWDELPEQNSCETNSVDLEEAGFEKLRFAPDARLPDCVESLRMIDDLFNDTWRRKRDHDLRDTSASGYEYSIVSQLVYAQASVQDIIDAVLSWRRIHGENIRKFTDKNAYHRRRLVSQILKMQQEIEASDATEGLSTYRTMRGSGYEQGAMANSELLKYISGRIGGGIEVQKIEAIMTQPKTYQMHTNFGFVELGGIENILKNSNFRQAVAEAISILPAQIQKTKSDPEGWDPVAEAIMDSAEEIRMDPEHTYLGALVEGLRSFCERDDHADDPEEAMDMGQYPFHHPDDGRWCVPLTGITRHLYLEGDSKITKNSIAKRLHQIGADSLQFQWRDADGRKRCRRVWKLPPNIFNEKFLNEIAELSRSLFSVSE